VFFSGSAPKELRITDTSFTLEFGPIPLEEIHRRRFELTGGSLLARHAPISQPPKRGKPIIVFAFFPPSLVGQPDESEVPQLSEELIYLAMALAPSCSAALR